MERIPEQMGYLILTMDGAVISVSIRQRRMSRSFFKYLPPPVNRSSLTATATNVRVRVICERFQSGGDLENNESIADIIAKAISTSKNLYVPDEQFQNMSSTSN